MLLMMNGIDMPVASTEYPLCLEVAVFVADLNCKGRS